MKRTIKHFKDQLRIYRRRPLSLVLFLLVNLAMLLTIASLILSLESVISVLAGMVILDEQLSSREILGCVLMFIAIVLAQLPEKKKAV